MACEFLRHRILRELRDQGPLSASALAVKLSVPRQEILDAVYELLGQGRIQDAIDGYQYELAHGGYSPDPGPLGAA